jgi:GTPase SAR1 family protein
MILRFYFRRVVSTHEAQQLADHHNLKYIETSAKTGHNVDMMFEMMASEIMNKIGENKLDFTNDVRNPSFITKSKLESN